MKLMPLIVLFILSFFTLSGQNVSLNYYLPDIEYNPEIPTPESILGYQVGEWHVSHDQLYFYMKTLADKSDRIMLKEYARTHENRPVVVLIISSPEHLENLEEIKRTHHSLTNPEISETVDISDIPVVIYQGYSVHGNEASGANASMLNAYYLAAGESPEVLEKLNNSVILLDPCFNPDGLHRFSTWVNMHKNKNLTSDPEDREYDEVWPGGRTNHYWFDLNRDWISVTHPESEGRMKLFHEWKPEILTDHHEMGTNSTFFFQPGIPQRTNPNTPQKNQILTEEIASYHVKELDKIKSLYFSKSNYDDYFYGKGSAYPDINGGVGILFEQASSRGHLQESENGILSLPFTIRNQVKTSLSTQKAGIELREELLEYKRMFFQDAQEKAQQNSIKGYLISDQDNSKLNRFLEILNIHDIDVLNIENDVDFGIDTYEKDYSYFIPLEQYQNKLIKTLFETESEFKDSIFYDVSTWTMPLAFDLQYTSVSTNNLPKIEQGSKLNSFRNKPGKVINARDAYAFIFDWSDYFSPTVLYKIMENDIRTKVLTKPLVIEIEDELKTFERGSILIPIQQQQKNLNSIVNLLENLTNDYPVSFFGINTGYGENNMSAGHPAVETLKKPEVMVVVGDGVRSYNAGEIWHHFDTKLEIPITKMEIDDISSNSINRYNTIILPSGNYSLGERKMESIKDWISKGGNLILIDRSIEWAIRNKLITLEPSKSDVTDIKQSSYAMASQDRGARVLGGAIFETKGDLTHPLLYGYADDKIPVFRRSSSFYKPTSNIYASPLKYTDNPRMSGYTPRGAEEAASGSVAVSVHSRGRGKIIAIFDNPVFRGFWIGGNKIFNNAVFFSGIISSSTTSREE